MLEFAAGMLILTGGFILFGLVDHHYFLKIRTLKYLDRIKAEINHERLTYGELQ